MIYYLTTATLIFMCEDIIFFVWKLVWFLIGVYIIKFEMFNLLELLQGPEEARKFWDCGASTSGWNVLPNSRNPPLPWVLSQTAAG